MKPNHLIFVTDGIYPHSVGGMQRHSLLLIKALASEPNIHLYVIHPHKGVKIFGSYSNITETVSEVPEKGIYLKQCYEYSKQVYRAISEMPEYLIYSQGLSVWYRAADFKRRLIVNPHGLEPWQTITLKETLISFPFRLVMNRIFKNASKVVSLGGRLTRILKKLVPENKIVVLPNAVNPASPLTHDFSRFPLQLLFVGRFAHNKGIDILLRAALQLNREGFEQKLIFNFVGKGPLYNDLTERYKAPNIVFHGLANDEVLEQLYQSCHLFVLPTLFEGMPTVVLEAMAHGMPVIVTDTGATAELVDETNGFLISKNSILSLTDAIKKFVALPQQIKQQLSDNSIKRVNENFIWKAVADRHIGLFKTFWN